MRLRDFSFTIPEGRETADGYVELSHCAHYTLNLSNDTPQKCDVEVFIDGGRVGTWRIDARSAIRIERPVHDTGKFTFYRAGTAEGNEAGIVVSDSTGLLRAIFKPEPSHEQPLCSRPLTWAGGTGLSGQSGQKFRSVAALDYDAANFVTINLRLVAPADDPRPLFPSSTPVPPPVEKPSPKLGGAVTVQYAGFWRRLAALLVDWLIMGLVSFGPIYVYAYSAIGTSSDREIRDTINLFGIIVWWLYFAVMESSQWQATAGKLALGIRVTDLNGLRIGFGRATGRHFAKVLSAIPLGVGFLVAVFTGKKQALHDLLASCLVVRNEVADVRRFFPSPAPII